jgi:TM2 domain-containing membrane protein YozV
LAVAERDPYLCAAGSFFFPGLGQVYCGRILRGIVFLVPAFLLTIPYTLAYMSITYYHVELWRIWIDGYAFISGAIDLTVRVVATYDAYKVAKLTKTA